MPDMSGRDRVRIVAALTTVAMLLAIGTTTVHYLEGWSWVDSMYFTAMTVTTVGHGELYPTSEASKIMAVMLAFGGIMIVVYSMSVVGSIFFRSRVKGVHERIRRMRKGQVI